MININGLISQDIKQRISTRLNEIESCSNLSNLDVSSILKQIHFFPSKDIKNQNDLWKDISKLSVDLYTDYEYYKQFTFRNKFTSEEYNCALRSLGFVEIKGFWKSENKPNENLVFKYVTLSCIYRAILMKINGGDSINSNLHKDSLKYCPFCDKDLNSQARICETCDATIEEIEKFRNQIKLLNENANNGSENDPSVAAEDEVIENVALIDKHDDLANVSADNVKHSDNCSNENILLKNERNKYISSRNFSDKHKKQKNSETENGNKSLTKDNLAVSIITDGKIDENKNNEITFTMDSKGENFDLNASRGGKIGGKHDGEPLVCDEWECKHCGCFNKNENINCAVCMQPPTEWKCKHCPTINQIASKQCTTCEQFPGKESNNKNIDKYGVIDSWKCGNKKFVKRNDGKELYCYHINDLHGSTCDECLLPKIAGRNKMHNRYALKKESYSSFRAQSSEFKINVADRNRNDKNVEISNNKDNANNKWKCSNCQSVNAQEFLSCTNCKSARMEIWTCKQCEMHNRISDDRCAACGEENENKKIKYCIKCKQREIICDELCGDCLLARDVKV